MNRYRFRSPEGVLVETTNLAALCNEHGLNRSNMWHIYNQTQSHFLRSHHGWTHADCDRRQLTNCGGEHYLYRFRAPDGTIHETYHVVQFAAEHGLLANGLYRLSNHTMNTYRGWTRP